MTNIVDRRFMPKDMNINNRRKFIDRYKAVIKKSIRKAVQDNSIKDFSFKNKKIKVKIDSTDDSLDLPNISNDPEHGIYDYIGPGNKKYHTGDKIQKPKNGGGKSKGSNSGGGEDDFVFELTDAEFSSLFFEDLELPDMIKKQFTGDCYEIQRCGYSNTGGPSSLNIKQTVIRAFMRRAALQKQNNKCEEILDDPEKIKKKRINFFEEIDLRFNYRDRIDIPNSRAVMFCLMDVSGSMGEREKDIAKRFFILLNLFLNRNYKQVDVVFVRHAEWAEECTEEVFFHGRESGGTIISTGYEVINSIISSRYDPELWNVYIAQASDGDNYEEDSAHMEDCLNRILKQCQYFSYIEIGSALSTNQPSSTFKILDKMRGQAKNLQIRLIDDFNQIFEVFRSLFKKRDK